MVCGGRLRISGWEPTFGSGGLAASPCGFRAGVTPTPGCQLPDVLLRMAAQTGDDVTEVLVGFDAQATTASHQGKEVGGSLAPDLLSDIQPVAPPHDNTAHGILDGVVSKSRSSIFAGSGILSQRGS